MTDVLIAGGGIAGSTAAIALGRLGFAVELFERSRFPREKACGEGLMPAGVAALRRLGVASCVVGRPFQGIRYHLGRHRLEVRFPRIGGIPQAGLGLRRKDLDLAAFEMAASTPGVIARCGLRVGDPIVESGRVVGLRVGGASRYAKLVVAADGAHSTLRRRLGLEAPIGRPRGGIRAHFSLPPDSSPPPWVEVLLCDGYELYVTPLPENMVLVAALADAARFRLLTGAAFTAWCKAPPALARLLEGAEQITALRGSIPLAGMSRRGVAPGIVLLGDAAGFVDPITGGGMTQALLTAELLAKFAADRFGRDDEWIWDFERERRLLLRNHEILTRAMVWLTRRPGMARGVWAALRHLPGLASRLVGVAGGVRSTGST